MNMEYYALILALFLGLTMALQNVHAIVTVDVMPGTNNTYRIGNSSIWYKSIYAVNLFTGAMNGNLAWGNITGAPAFILSGANVSTITCGAGNHISAINNATGIVTCSADTAGSETDPLWSANYSALNASWNTTYNSSYMTNTYNSSYITNTYNSTYDTYNYRTNTSLLTIFNTTVNQWLYNQTSPAQIWSGQNFVTLNNTTLYNYTLESTNYVNKNYIALNNTTIATIGACSGQVVTKTTNGGVTCSAINSSLIGNGIVANSNLASVLTINWANLTSYPSACGAGTAVTTLGSSPTCSAFASVPLSEGSFASQAINTTAIKNGAISNEDLNASLTINWANLSTFNLNSGWTNSLGFGNLTNLNLNQSWTGTLGWGNLTGYDLNKAWANTLGLGNLTGQSASWFNNTNMNATIEYQMTSCYSNTTFNCQGNITRNSTCMVLTGPGGSVLELC